MPAKNCVKFFVENGYYHIYNRGVEKRKIFQDIQDYKVFLNYLKEYLSPPIDPFKLKTHVTVQGTSFKGVARQNKNYHKDIDLLAYCLMPNHFHILIKQNKPRVMENFMRSLSTRYSMYFNKKYKRVGPLFQGIYKAILIENENYLLHLSRYIHINPREYTKNLLKAYSSYPEYLGIRKTLWINPQLVLPFFKSAFATFPDLKNVNSYKMFVENYIVDPNEALKSLILEQE